MSLKADPYDSDTTLTHRELLAARGYQMPRRDVLSVQEPRNGPGWYLDTPEADIAAENAT